MSDDGKYYYSAADYRAAQRAAEAQGGSITATGKFVSGGGGGSSSKSKDFQTTKAWSDMTLSEQQAYAARHEDSEGWRKVRASWDAQAASPSNSQTQTQQSGLRDTSAVMFGGSAAFQAKAAEAGITFLSGKPESSLTQTERDVIEFSKQYQEELGPTYHKGVIAHNISKAEAKKQEQKESSESIAPPPKMWEAAPKKTFKEKVSGFFSTVGSYFSPLAITEEQRQKGKEIRAGHIDKHYQLQRSGGSAGIFEPSPETLTFFAGFGETLGVVKAVGESAVRGIVSPFRLSYKAVKGDYDSFESVLKDQQDYMSAPWKLGYTDMTVYDSEGNVLKQDYMKSPYGSADFLAGQVAASSAISFGVGAAAKAAAAKKSATVTFQKYKGFRVVDSFDDAMAHDVSKVKGSVKIGDKTRYVFEGTPEYVWDKTDFVGKSSIKVRGLDAVDDVFTIKSEVAGHAKMSGSGWKIYQKGVSYQTGSYDPSIKGSFSVTQTGAQTGGSTKYAEAIMRTDSYGNIMDLGSAKLSFRGLGAGKIQSAKVFESAHYTGFIDDAGNVAFSSPKTIYSFSGKTLSLEGDVVKTAAKDYFTAGQKISITKTPSPFKFADKVDDFAGITQSKTHFPSSGDSAVRPILESSLKQRPFIQPSLDQIKTAAETAYQVDQASKFFGLSQTTSVGAIAAPYLESAKKSAVSHSALFHDTPSSIIEPDFKRISPKSVVIPEMKTKSTVQVTSLKPPKQKQEQITTHKPPIEIPRPPVPKKAPPTPPPPPPHTPLFPPPTPPPLPPLPPLDYVKPFGLGHGKTRTQIKAPTPRYKPSLVAVSLGITAPKAPKRTTGMDIRPVIMPKASKTKKSIKKKSSPLFGKGFKLWG